MTTFTTSTAYHQADQQDGNFLAGIVAGARAYAADFADGFRHMLAHTQF